MLKNVRGEHADSIILVKTEGSGMLPFPIYSTTSSITPQKSKKSRFEAGLSAGQIQVLVYNVYQTTLTRHRIANEYQFVKSFFHNNVAMFSRNQ